MEKHHRRRQLPLGADNFLSVLEGVEGGFAIFAGIIVGLSFEMIDRRLIIMTATLSIIVNAFNASAVRYASEHYIDELDGHEKRNQLRSYFLPALIEFGSYVLVSLIAILPLLLIESWLVALIVCVTITLLLLFAAGWYRGHLLGRHALRDGIELVWLGGLIITIGGGAGWVVSKFIA